MSSYLAPSTPSPQPGPSPSPQATPSPQPGASPMPPAAQFFVDAIKRDRWPQIDSATLDAWAADHRHLAQQLIDAADSSQHTYVPLFHELLRGRAGDALQKALAANMNTWRSYAADHQDAATALSHAADYVAGLESDLTEIINAYESTYVTAINNNRAAEANAILLEAEGEAQSAATHATDRVSSALKGKFGTFPPLPTSPQVLSYQAGAVTAATA